MLKINEIFVSLQGETSLVGLPCVFIRMTGCNLRCRYCDTQYAYHEGHSYAVDELIKTVSRLQRHRFVITGGEPLLQKETIPFIGYLLESGKQVILETNGSVLIKHIPKPVIRIIDLKAPSSGMTASMRWQNLEGPRSSDQIKFVLSNKRDFPWALRILEQYELLHHCEVLMSPSHGTLKKKKLAQWILETPYDIRMQIQLHKIIWGGHARGV